MSTIWFIISSLALVLFVAYLIGANTRLSRLRQDVDEKFRTLEKSINQQLDVMRACVNELDDDLEDRALQERLKQSLEDFSTRLSVINGKPRQQMQMAELEAANVPLDQAWQAYTEQGTDLVGAPLPEEMLQAWRDCAVLTTSAQQAYNQSSEEYNASCALIPAHYLALLRKLPKARSIQLTMNSHIEDRIKTTS